MNSPDRKIIQFSVGAMLAIFVCGCGVTLSPVKRKPLQIIGYETGLQPSMERIQVHFAETLPGQSLAETV